MSASSNDWCWQLDKAIKGIPSVNDFLMEGKMFGKLQFCICRILDNCCHLDITISKWKLEVATQVKFAGFHVSTSGIIPVPSHFKAIINFLRSGNVAALQWFIGLINQLNIFTPEVTMKTNQFRGLLKKGASSFQWLPKHKATFMQAKLSLVHHVRLHHINHSLHICLIYRWVEAEWVGKLLNVLFINWWWPLANLFLKSIWIKKVFLCSFNQGKKYQKEANPTQNFHFEGKRRFA